MDSLPLALHRRDPSRQEPHLPLLRKAPVLIIAVDFDGTLVEHKFPKIGRSVPGAFEALKILQAEGARLILWTMRSDNREADGPVLTEAVEFCRQNGVEFWGINHNPEQSSWTSSPKAYAQVYVDDAALGCPLYRPHDGSRPYVDWSFVLPQLQDLLDRKKAA